MSIVAPDNSYEVTPEHFLIISYFYGIPVRLLHQLFNAAGVRVASYSTIKKHQTKSFLQKIIVFTQGELYKQRDQVPARSVATVDGAWLQCKHSNGCVMYIYARTTSGENILLGYKLIRRDSYQIPGERVSPKSLEALCAQGAAEFLEELNKDPKTINCIYAFVIDGDSTSAAPFISKGFQQFLDPRHILNTFPKNFDSINLEKEGKPLSHAIGKIQTQISTLIGNLDQSIESKTKEYLKYAEQLSKDKAVVPQRYTDQFLEIINTFTFIFAMCNKDNNTQNNESTHNQKLLSLSKRINFKISVDARICCSCLTHIYGAVAPLMLLDHLGTHIPDFFRHQLELAFNQQTKSFLLNIDLEFRRNVNITRAFHTFGQASIQYQHGNYQVKVQYHNYNDNQCALCKSISVGKTLTYLRGKIESGLGIPLPDNCFAITNSNGRFYDCFVRLTSACDAIQISYLQAPSFEFNNTFEVLIPKIASSDADPDDVDLKRDLPQNLVWIDGFPHAASSQISIPKRHQKQIATASVLSQLEQQSQEKVNLTDAQILEDINKRKIHCPFSSQDIKKILATPITIRNEIRATEISSQFASTLVPEYAKYHLTTIDIINILNEEQIRKSQPDLVKSVEDSLLVKKDAPKYISGFPSKDNQTLICSVLVLVHVPSVCSKLWEFRQRTSYFKNSLQIIFARLINENKDYPVILTDLVNAFNRIHISPDDYNVSAMLQLLFDHVDSGVTSYIKFPFTFQSSEVYSSAGKSVDPQPESLFLDRSAFSPSQILHLPIDRENPSISQALQKLMIPHEVEYLFSGTNEFITVDKWTEFSKLPSVLLIEPVFSEEITIAFEQFISPTLLCSLEKKQGNYIFLGVVFRINCSNGENEFFPICGKFSNGNFSYTGYQRQIEVDLEIGDICCILQDGMIDLEELQGQCHPVLFSYICESDLQLLQEPAIPRQVMDLAFGANHTPCDFALDQNLRFYMRVEDQNSYKTALVPYLPIVFDDDILKSVIKFLAQYCLTFGLSRRTLPIAFQLLNNLPYVNPQKSTISQEEFLTFMIASVYVASKIEDRICLVTRLISATEVFAHNEQILEKWPVLKDIIFNENFISLVTQNSKRLETYYHFEFPLTLPFDFIQYYVDKIISWHFLPEEAIGQNFSKNIQLSAINLLVQTFRPRCDVEIFQPKLFFGYNQHLVALGAIYFAFQAKGIDIKVLPSGNFFGSYICDCFNQDHFEDFTSQLQEVCATMPQAIKDCLASFPPILGNPETIRKSMAKWIKIPIDLPKPVEDICPPPPLEMLEEFGVRENITMNGYAPPVPPPPIGYDNPEVEVIFDLVQTMEPIQPPAGLTNPLPPLPSLAESRRKPPPKKRKRKVVPLRSAVLKSHPPAVPFNSMNIVPENSDLAGIQFGNFLEDEMDHSGEGSSDSGDIFS